MYKLPQFLTGIGQDSHRLREAKKNEILTLAGVPFDCGLTLEADSDGDVILHALFNALSTSIGGGSLGATADDMCQQGITDSRAYIDVILAKITERGYRINNISISIEAARPRLEKYFGYLKNSLAKICQLPPEQIGLSVTSGEKLTACGRGEGISAFASVMLEQILQ